jgi:cytochrome c biogenesis protein CcdA
LLVRKNSPLTQITVYFLVALIISFSLCYLLKIYRNSSFMSFWTPMHMRKIEFRPNHSYPWAVLIIVHLFVVNFLIVKVENVILLKLKPCSFIDSIIYYIAGKLVFNINTYTKNINVSFISSCHFLINYFGYKKKREQC